MKREGMPTQRHEEKRVEERTSAWERERERAHAHRGERERMRALAPPFVCFFLPPGLPYANWASQECCLFYLRSSLWSSDLPLTFLFSIFAGFPFLVF